MNYNEFKDVLSDELFSVYDLDVYSIQELLYKLIDKVGTVDEQIEFVNELIKEFLSDEGVRKHLNLIIEKLQVEGTLKIGIDDNQTSKYLTWSSDKLNALFESTNSTIQDEINHVIESLKDFIKSAKTSISVTEFGAKLDGVTDDTQAIQQAHSFANLVGLPVVYPKGKLVLNDTVYIKTSVDMSQVEVIVSNNQIGKTLFHIDTDHELTPIQVNTSSWTKNKVVLDELANYPHHVVCIKSNENLCLRDGVTPYKKEETNALLRDGELMYGGLLCDYINGGVSVQVRPIDTHISIKLPIFKYGVTETNKYCKLVKCFRDNVKFIGGQVIIPSRANVENTTWVGSLFENYYCINQHYDGLISPNITGKVASGNSAYVISGMYMCGLTLERVLLTSDTWGSIGCGSCKEIHVRDSKINRLDCHVLQTNMHIVNSEIVGKQQVNIGCGRGVVMINNCHFHHENATHMINHRTDYGGMFEGDIFITNCKYESKSTSENHCLYMGNANGKTENVAYRFYCPNLHITNLKVDTLSQFVVYSLPQTQNGATFQLPFEVNVDNVTQRYENDERYVSVFFVARNHTSFYTDSGSKCHVTINRVNRQTKESFNLTTEQSQNVRDNYYRNRPLFYFENYDASTSNYQNRMVVKISHSTGSVHINNHNVELNVDHSHIWGFKCCYGGGKTPKRVIISNSTIFPIVYGSLNGSPLDCTNLQMTGCVIRPISINGTSIGISLENPNNCISLIGNVINNPKSANYANILFGHIGERYAQLV